MYEESTTIPSTGMLKFETDFANLYAIFFIVSMYISITQFFTLPTRYLHFAHLTAFLSFYCLWVLIAYQAFFWLNLYYKIEYGVKLFILALWSTMSLPISRIIIDFETDAITFFLLAFSSLGIILHTDFLRKSKKTGFSTNRIATMLPYLFFSIISIFTLFNIFGEPLSFNSIRLVALLLSLVGLFFLLISVQVLLKLRSTFENSKNSSDHQNSSFTNFFYQYFLILSAVLIIINEVYKIIVF